MTDDTDANRPDADRPDELDAETERTSFASARRHVGAAGFAQRNVLEQIITAGREQLAVTQAQLDAAPVAAKGNAAQTHRAALEGILTSGRIQIETANELRWAILSTLANVRGTPLEDVSANVLTNLGEVVRRQATELDHIIAAAINEASTVEQVADLERVGAEATTRVINLEHDRAERELAHLDVLGAQALDRIRSLEAGGQTHARQKAQLEQEAQASLANISALEAEQTRGLAEIARLEQRTEASSARVAELEAAAVGIRERIRDLHHKLEQDGAAAEPQARPQN